MASQETSNNCTRGYVFAVASEPDNIAERILQINKDLKEEEGFIIRADTMKSPSVYNLVIPFNVISEEILNNIATQIKEIPGIEEINISIVDNYYPHPPHNAIGIICARESNPSGFSIEGRNVWG